MPFVRCAQPADAAAAFAAVKAAQDEALFLFFGSEDPGTGQSWCKDCVVADPVLRAAIARLRPDLTVYECPVGERAAWKGRADHPYRRDADARLERIPTLIHLIDGCEQGRLVEADAADPAGVAAFLKRDP